MSRNRLIKYGRILNFQQQQLDLVKQQIGAQRQLISQLTGNRVNLENELTNVAEQFEVNVTATMYHQQINLSMVAIQRKINSARIEIATAEEKLDHLLHTFREQNKQLKSWEKLVEQETNRQISATLAAELHSADERYLATQFGGVQK